MSCAVILVAWLAMMPQLVPKQRTDFFDWAMSTLLPAVTFPAAKRLAIFLDWAGSGSPHQHFARTHDVKAAVCSIILDVTHYSQHLLGCMIPVLHVLSLAERPSTIPSTSCCSPCPSACSLSPPCPASSSSCCPSSSPPLWD